MNQPVFWLVQAGMNGEDRFRHWLENDYCAIGFRDAPKIRRHWTDAEIARELKMTWPTKYSSVPNWLSSIRAFFTGMNIGEIVVTLEDGVLHFGEIKGGPEYVEGEVAEDYRHRRRVRWGPSVPKPGNLVHLYHRKAVQKVDKYRDDLLELWGQAAQPERGTCDVGLPYEDANEDCDVADIKAYVVDKKLIKAARDTHSKLQNGLRRRAENEGRNVRRPRPDEPQYDLAWLDDQELLTLCEVKSLTPDNEADQIRAGVGQLLDYADHFRNRPEGLRRVLWIGHKPRHSAHWKRVCASAGIILAWPGKEAQALGTVGNPTEADTERLAGADTLAHLS